MEEVETMEISGWEENERVEKYFQEWVCSLCLQAPWDEHMCDNSSLSQEEKQRVETELPHPQLTAGQ